MLHHLLSSTCSHADDNLDSDVTMVTLSSLNLPPHPWVPAICNNAKPLTSSNVMKWCWNRTGVKSTHVLWEKGLSRQHPSLSLSHSVNTAEKHVFNTSRIKARVYACVFKIPRVNPGISHRGRPPFSGEFRLSCKLSTAPVSMSDLEITFARSFFQAHFFSHRIFSHTFPLSLLYRGPRGVGEHDSTMLR